MAEYTAPLRDMQFVINELIGMPRVQELAGFDEISTDLTDAVLEEAAKFATQVLSPLNRVGDTTGSRLEGDVVHTPPGWRAAYAAFCEGGWNGLANNPEFGGQGLPKVVATAVGEMWDAANMAFGLCPMLTAGAIEAIEQHGNDHLRETFLAKLIAGAWTGTMNLTEPQAGSDLSAVRSRAVPNGDHYLISGQKIYITYGEHDLTDNIVHLVLARLPDAPAGTRGISLFAVPKVLVNADGSLGRRNDLRCVSLEHKLGIHGSPTAVMSYGDNGGAVGYLVGELNRGLMHMFTMMNAARHAVGREGVAIAERAYQQALLYARERVQGRAEGAGPRSTIIEHPDVKRMLMTMKCQIEAMRALSYLCAVEYDTAQLHPDAARRARAERRGDLLTPIVKAWCTETGVQLTSLGMQVHGGMGYIEETGAAQYLRDARITPIYEGTTGIQAGDLVGRKTLRDGGQAMGELIADMRATILSMRSLTGTAAQVRDALAVAVDQLETVVAWLCASAADPRLSASAAVSYLQLAGLVCGGWMMAEAAARSAAAEQRNDDFYRAKLTAAGFYSLQLLPQAGALAQIIVHGSSSIADIDTALL